ncbi:restriction endonuclease subunit S [Aliarcobacter cryaerophilus]|uniref:restriction endonuclease subunit S n=1 Tax=Aliarcobacter cryaerophilus TaxID=28198 RepID=UPI0021B3933F|nr:restriction endonuclease subunit S [Aliarcobacter cryaerophilus]MCT7495926.1 restriction endonuclease subunit S [Aliarcobacter cryaerophilus]
MSSWKECKLGDVVSSNNKTVDKNYKFQNIQYLDTGSLTNNKIDGFQEFKINEAPSRAKRLVKHQDIVYSTVRPIQRHFGFIENPQENLVVSTGFSVIETNQKLAYPKFIYYFLSSDEIVEILDVIAEASTSAYPSLKPSDIENLDISLPPLEEQKAIAEVLSSLDDKIDLLHRQNQTLESLAQTLFRQWFEDKEFDGIIGDIIKLQSGYAFKSKDFQDFGIHGVLKIKNISNSIIDIFNTDFIDLTVANKTDEKFKILSGDILFGMTGAEIGKMGIVPKTDKNLWLNQRVGVLREKYLGAKYLAYLQLTSEFGFDYITNTATGSAQPNISASEIEQCPFVKLEVDEIENYSNEISPLFEKIIFNLGQIQTLENLRDTLLPKLLSGEIILK